MDSLRNLLPRAAAPAALLIALLIVWPSAAQANTGWNGTFQCTARYSTVSAKPSGFAIGNCSTGNTLRRQNKSVVSATGSYEGGKIGGNFSDCGWVAGDQSTPINTTDIWTECNEDSIGYNDSEFIFSSGGALYYDTCRVPNPTGQECKGTPIVNTKACIVVANTHPWKQNQTWTNDVIYDGAVARWIPDHATVGGAPRFAWRYVGKYPTSDGVYWVMGRDRAASAGNGTWVFVPLYCLQ
jgi:hypothetical protein